jgi:hypothetical protein
MFGDIPRLTSQIVPIVPIVTTDVNGVITGEFTSAIPGTFAAGPSQNYRSPTTPEARSVINGLHLLTREAGKILSEVVTSDAVTLLTPNGMTVTTGTDQVSHRGYALVRSETTYPSSANYRAWGWYLVDLTQPVGLLVSAPHPRTDGNSEVLALRYTQRVPGVLLAWSSVNRKARDWLITEVSTDHTGGTYTLTFRGQTTVGIAPGASTTTIQTAIAAMSTVGSGYVNVTGDSANTSLHAFINLAGSLWNSGSPTDTITANPAGLTGGTFLTLDHDADVAHNANSVFSRLCGEYSRFGVPHLQLHGYADVSSGVPRVFSAVVSRGSSNTSGLVEATRTALEAAGFDIATRDTYDTQGLYISGGATGGSFTLTCGGQTTAVISFSATPTTLASNTQTALEALSSVAVGNVRVSVSTNANGSIPTLVITFQRALYHAGLQVTVAVNNLTGGTAPTPVMVTANTTGLTAQSNTQGDAAELYGAPFLHIELAATVRESATLSAAVVDALVGANLPDQGRGVPLLAEIGHSTSQAPLVSGASATTGSTPIAARADHRHPATTNTPNPLDLVTRNAADTGWTAAAPNSVAASMTNVLHTEVLTTGEETVPLELVSSSAIGVTSGSLRLTYFTARKSETTTGIRVTSGTTAAGATPTLIRVGLFSIDSSGNGTLVAVTPNDTTLFATASTPYTKSWSTPYAKVAGQRYAWGILIVTAAATPTFPGYSIAAALDVESGLSPRGSGRLLSLTDIPSSFTAGSVTTTINRFYGVLV